MMPRIAALAATFVAAVGLVAASAGPESAKLDALVGRFVKVRGDGGGGIGASASRRAETFRALRTDLDAIDLRRLTPEEQIDWLAMKGQIAGTLHELETLRPWKSNPELFIQFESVASALWDDASPAKKAGLIVAQLNSAVAALAEARSTVGSPPKLFTEGALYQAREWLAFLETDLATFAKGQSTEALAVAAANAKAISALRSFIEYLQSDLLPRSTGTFAIGNREYARILQERWFMKTGPEEILARGRQAFADTERLAQQVAERMAPGRSWVEVYENLKNDHPPADRLKEEYQSQMEAAQAFVKQHKIVTLPEGERVITIDTPPARRRSSPFGTFSSVSPFGDDLVGRLVLTPIEDHLSQEQRRERLRSHHRAWIPIIAVHEAYPGHHVQAIKARENPRILRRVIRESIFSEGWGLYTEEMMYEQGFLKGDDVRLTQLRNRLWRAARVIIDVGLHTGVMTFEEGVKFLVDRVRFEPYAAELEVGMYARRPTYVLGYLVGMLEIQEMRASYEAKFGKPHEPRIFYDRLLRIGALPPSLVRAELLGEKPPLPN
jgi:hypothetical protein